jgi:hypothetical protein
MSMKIEKVQDRKEIKSVVEKCFSGDDELINKYHIKAGTCLEDCVEDTCNVLENYTCWDFEFYKIIDKDVIGFIGFEPSISHLTTFCLIKEHRTEKNKKGMWTFINYLLPEGFNSALYKKNERAIKYLTHNGCTVKSESVYNNEPIVILNFKKEVL